jgi:hypothetical protein
MGGRESEGWESEMKKEKKEEKKLTVGIVWTVSPIFNL